MRISLLSLNRPQDALVSFAEAEKFGCTDKSLVMWKAKAELSLRNKGKMKAVLLFFQSDY